RAAGVRTRGAARSVRRGVRPGPVRALRGGQESPGGGRERIPAGGVPGRARARAAQGARALRRVGHRLRRRRERRQGAPHGAQETAGRRMIWKTRARASALAIGLALSFGLAPARSRADDKKPTPEPFYRKYLVPGTPLDDKIIEQEKRVEASPDDA